jgi:hypothetical protein
MSTTNDSTLPIKKRRIDDLYMSDKDVELVFKDNCYYCGDDLQVIGCKEPNLILDKDELGIIRLACDGCYCLVDAVHAVNGMSKEQFIERCRKIVEHDELMSKG